MLGRFRTVSRALWLGLLVATGCAEAALNDETEIEALDSSSTVLDASAEAGSEAGVALDADLIPWPEASVQLDSAVSGLDASPGVDAGSDAGARDAGGSDAGARDAGSDAGPRDAGSDASRPDAGSRDSGTPDAGGADSGSNMCDPENCTNTCTSAAQGPFRCCQKDGQCGCSWVSGITSCN